jgi:hypothetical protein
MKISPPSRYLLLGLCIGTLLAATTIFAGCTQPAPAPAAPAPAPLQIFPTPTPEPTPAVVSVEKPDTSHIVITFNGGPDRANIIEIDATVTDNKGESQTQHLGDRLATSPVGGGSKLQFNGLYSGGSRVFISAWYADGSSRQLLDTTV